MVYTTFFVSFLSFVFLSILYSIYNKASKARQAERYMLERDARRYTELCKRLSSIAPPKDCALCNTHKNEHYLNCPYLQIGFALDAVERIK
jgi:cbb3-type cytochrome oxidase subunit 3